MCTCMHRVADYIELAECMPFAGRQLSKAKGIDQAC